MSNYNRQPITVQACKFVQLAKVQFVVLLALPSDVRVTRLGMTSENTWEKTGIKLL